MKRAFHNAWLNVRRSPFQAMAAILVVAMTFFMIYEFGLVLGGSYKVLNYFETRPQVTAFFNDEVNEETILQLKQSLEQQAYVKSVKYISKIEALALYREQNKQDPLLLEMVTADILPASLEVQASNVEGLATIKTTLSDSAGVEEVVYQQDVIEKLTNWTKGIWKASLIRVGMLGLMTFGVLTVIISIRVSMKKKEIVTMKLLGAGKGFIRGPFIIEGAIYGFFGSCLSWGLTYILLLYETPMLLKFIGEVGVLPVSPILMLELWGVITVMAVFLGMISGYVSSSRYGD